MECLNETRFIKKKNNFTTLPTGGPFEGRLVDPLESWLEALLTGGPLEGWLVGPLKGWLVDLLTAGSLEGLTGSVSLEGWLVSQ